jgi:hypothetical protein
MSSQSLHLLLSALSFNFFLIPRLIRSKANKTKLS